MCLYYDGQKTKECRKEWKESGEKTRKFYKNVLVYKHGNGYRIRSYWMENNYWNVGENISDRPTKKLSGTENKRKEIYRGIHVYTRKDVFCDYPTVRLEVTVNIDDLVGIGSYPVQDPVQAVFTKVRVTKKARKEAIDFAILNKRVCYTKCEKFK